MTEAEFKTLRVGDRILWHNPFAHEHEEARAGTLVAFRHEVELWAVLFDKRGSYAHGCGAYAPAGYGRWLCVEDGAEWELLPRPSLKEQLAQLWETAL